MQPSGAPSDDTNEYERERLIADRRLVVTVLMAMLVPSALFVVNDALLARNDARALAWMIGMRVAGLVVLSIAALSVARVQTRAALDRRVLITAALAFVSMIGLHLVRPRDSVLPTYFETLLVVGVYAGVPLPTRRQLQVGVVGSAALLAVDYFWNVDISAPTRLALAGTFTIANVLGWLISRNRAALIARESEGWVRERATRLDLEHTLGELRTLRGIIPVCAGCSKVRAEDGDWQQLQAYVRSHTDAEFSHGLCPACLSRLYPDVAEVVNRAIGG